MYSQTPDDQHELSEILHFHFDVHDHYLSVETFIAAANSAQKAIEALNQSFFAGELEYELIILPPSSGTFLKKLGLWISGGIASIMYFLETDIGKAYFEGLTGEQPAHWAKLVGEVHQDILEKAQSTNEALIEDQTIGDCRVGSKIIVKMTQGIFEATPTSLKRSGFEQVLPIETLEARSEFFEACLIDKRVKGVGFTPEDDFPIRRANFPERAIKPKRREDEDKPTPWTSSIESIFVTSPNWDKDDQSARKWKGKDSVRRDCYFTIEDEEFWSRVRHGELRVDVLDNLKVQWAFQILDGKPRNRRVLKVVEFNGEILANPLSKGDLDRILEDYEISNFEMDQSSFF